MKFQSLGYIGIGSAKREEWSTFATKLLGMQLVDRGGGLNAYRMDDRKQRLVVTPASDERLQFVGFEVANSHELSSLADKLANSGVPVTAGEKRLADERWVEQLLVFHDPEGNRIEAFCNPHISSDPFKPGRPMTGFKTGTLGMGHVVLDVVNIDRLLPFYRDLLGFNVSDFGHLPYKLYFFHLNHRHHSFAMVEGGRGKIHHIMVEATHIDDVGQGYDLAQLEEGRVAYTLGRHTNDHVMSFYSHSPSEFFVEFGWGGRLINPDTWKAHQTHDGPSLWGHERLYMEPEPRKRLRDMRLNAAAKGVRAPLAPDCLWLDSVIRQE